jgi:hypothetical protein
MLTTEITAQTYFGIVHSTFNSGSKYAQAEYSFVTKH